VTGSLDITTEAVDWSSIWLNAEVLDSEPVKYQPTINKVTIATNIFIADFILTPVILDILTKYTD
jgi:hypothetical protein